MLAGIHLVVVLVDDVWVIERQNLDQVSQDVFVTQLLELVDLDVVRKLRHLHLEVGHHHLLDGLLVLVGQLQVSAHYKVTAHLLLVLFYYIFLYVLLVQEEHVSL